MVEGRSSSNFHIAIALVLQLVKSELVNTLVFPVSSTFEVHIRSLPKKVSKNFRNVEREEAELTQLLKNNR